MQTKHAKRSMQQANYATGGSAAHACEQRWVRYVHLDHVRAAPEAQCSALASPANWQRMLAQLASLGAVEHM